MSERYDSVAGFYAARDPQLRRFSPEWDYGVHWHDGPERWPVHRVSWVVQTGELIAVKLGGDGGVEVLGVVARVGEYPYGSHEAWVEFVREQPIERVLEGWADEWPRDLEWIRERLRGAP